MVFAATMIALGVIGFIKGDFAPIWQPSPESILARELLVYLCAFVSLAGGVGLLFRRAAPIAARLLLIYFLSWLLLFRLSKFFRALASQDSWSGWAETATITAGAWILYIWFATDWDTRHFRLATGGTGLRIARIAYGVALIIFGVAHFNYLKETATLVPDWLPWHLFWAFFFGCTFVASGLAVLIGVCARLATAMAALQLGIFTLFVWVPVIMKHPDAFQWSEFLISVAATAGAWMLANSYRQLPTIYERE